MNRSHLSLGIVTTTIAIALVFILQNAITINPRLLLGGAAGTPTTYYISSSGDDTNDGTSPDTPLKTIDKVNTLPVLPGDSILFKRGDTFYGTIKVTHSGTSDAPITYGAYGGGDKPIITGFTKLTSWKKTTGNIYEADCAQCGSTVNMVTLDGAPKAMGRYPNADAANGGYLTYTKHSGTYAGVVDDSIKGASVTITDPTLPDSPNWTGAELVVRKDHWVLDRALITAQSAGEITYTSPTNYVPFNNFGYFIQNDIRTLDQNGEWYYNPVTKKMDMYFSDDPNAHTINASTVSILLLSQSKGDIVINNIAFKGANTTAINIYGGQITAALDAIDVSLSGQDAIFAGRLDKFDITNSTFKNNNSDAIDCVYMCNTTTIANNTVENSGLLAGMGLSGSSTYLGILVSGEGSVIKNNTVRNSGYMGIRFYGGAVIENNIVDRFESVKDDGGAIYSGLFYEGEGPRKVIGNFISNGLGAAAGASASNYCGHSFSNHGIYFDYSATNIEVTGNTVMNTGGGLFIYNAHDVIVKDNNFINDQIGLFIQKSAQSADLIRNNVFKNNVIVSSDPSYNSMCLMSSETNPDDLKLLGNIDNNIYVRPDSDTSGFTIKDKTHPVATTFSFSDWQKKYPYDTNSQIKNISSTRIESNPTPSPSTISLTGTYVDVSGTKYTNTATIPAYGSLVLFKSTDITPTTDPTSNPPTPPVIIDTVPPTLTISGSTVITLTQGSIFTDPGATASDNVDGDITSHITTVGSVDTNTLGTYTITYQVSDAVGNKAQATRTITIIPVPPQVVSGGGYISSPSSVTVTTSQTPDAPVSHTIEFHVEQTPVTPPAPVVLPQPKSPSKPLSVKPSSPKQAKTPVVQPVVVPQPPVTTNPIVSIEYTLNNELLHTTTTFPDTWNFDTTTLSDNAYVLKTTYYYQDHTTDTSVTIFTVKNGRTLIESIGHWIGGVWEKVLGWF